MRYVIATLIFALLIAHQDFWFWDDGTLVFGWMPIGLFYHAGLSLAAGLVWWLATIYAWPEELKEPETFADQKGESV